MRTFRIAFTGDFLNEHGASAYGDLNLGPLERAPHIEFHFLTRQSPTAGDPEYWRRFYSMEVQADDLRDVDGLVVLRPWIKNLSENRLGEGDSPILLRGLRKIGTVPAGSRIGSKEHALAAADRLVVIGRSGAGYDKIDVAACTRHDVALFNVPTVLDHSTASSALLFMLALAKRLTQQQRITRDARWDLQSAVMGSEIQGRVLGIIGLGRSGRELARLVAPFQMRVLACSPHAEPAQAAALGVRLATLDEVLSSADFVSLHARLTADNHGLIGREQLALLKPTAFLINVARGELVDQSALVDALAHGRIAGAALDVYQREPLPAGDPLAEFDNVILTPHWIASTRDVFAATSRAMTEGMLRAARGQVPANVVNPEVLDRPGFRAKLARFAENRQIESA